MPKGRVMLLSDRGVVGHPNRYYSLGSAGIQHGIAGEDWTFNNSVLQPFIPKLTHVFTLDELQGQNRLDSVGSVVLADTGPQQWRASEQRCNRGLWHYFYEDATLSGAMSFYPYKSLISLWWVRAGWSTGNPGIFFEIDNFIRIGLDGSGLIHVDIYDNSAWVSNFLVDPTPQTDSAGWKLINIYISNTGDTAKAYFYVSHQNIHTTPQLVDTYVGSPLLLTSGTNLSLAPSGTNFYTGIDEMYLFENINLDAASSRDAVTDALFNGSNGSFYIDNRTWKNYKDILTPYDTYLTAAYHFESGVDFLKDSKGSNDLTNVNGVSEDSNGKYGDCADFDGNNTNLSMDSNADVLPTTGFAISWWYNSDGATDEQQFITSGSGSPPYNNWYCGYSATNQFIYYMQQSDETAITETLTQGFTASTWYHLLMIADGTNLKFYVNGSQIGSSQSYDGTVNTIASTFRIGANRLGVASPDGKMDEFMFWKNIVIADTDAFATALYHAGNGSHYIG